jgi:hypothetical protein
VVKWAYRRLLQGRLRWSVTKRKRRQSGPPEAGGFGPKAKNGIRQKEGQVHERAAGAEASAPTHEAQGELGKAAEQSLSWTTRSLSATWRNE